MELFILLAFNQGAVMLFWLLGKILLCVVLCLLFVQLYELQKASQNMAEGNLSYKVNTAKMFWECRKHGENLNKINEGMTKAVDERMKSERLKTELITNVSHDIKTPLTVILGYLEIMRLRDCEDVTLQKVEAKAKQVMELIDQFFTLAKLEAGDKKIEMVKINISELCRETVLGYYDILIQKDYAVDIIIPEQQIFAQGDMESINRILNNLLSNAIRYGSDGKYIGLFVREDLDFVYIDVVDKGKGIEKQFAASVFERLYTMEDSRNRSIQGNGLGLTIARNLARQMGGDLLLQSQPGVRTVFTVKLRRYPII